jgi:hypothetical protein
LAKNFDLQNVKVLFQFCGTEFEVGTGNSSEGRTAMRKLIHPTELEEFESSFQKANQQSANNTG